MQDFELDDETDFLLGGTSQHAGTMEMNELIRSNRTPRKRRKFLSYFCRLVIFVFQLFFMLVTF